MTAARIDSQAISWRLGSCEKTTWEIPNTAMYMVVYTPQAAEWPFLWKQLALYRAAALVDAVMVYPIAVPDEVDVLAEAAEPHLAAA